ncbi:MAG: HNH endonuclease [Nitrospirales bacterium]
MCGRPATLVDHVRPKSIGGRDDESNYQSLCTVDHARKTGNERRRGIK